MKDNAIAKLFGRPGHDFTVAPDSADAIGIQCTCGSTWLSPLIGPKPSLSVIMAICLKHLQAVDEAT